MITVLGVLALIQAHWQTIVIVATAGGGLIAALQKQAYSVFFGLALELVRQVAVEELNGVDKRKKVVEEVYKALPLWAKGLIPQQQAEILAERAYSLLKGELKTQ
jgi:hypothetical protein